MRFSGIIIVGAVVGACGGKIEDSPGDSLPAPNPISSSSSDPWWVPESACIPLGEAPTTILDRDGQSQFVVGSLVPDGDALWFSSFDYRERLHGLQRVAVRGGEAEPLLVGDATTPIPAQLYAGQLVTVRSTIPESQTQAARHHLALRDMSTGKETALPSSDGFHAGGPIVRKSGIYWMSFVEAKPNEPNWGMASVARWDPAANRTTDVTSHAVDRRSLAVDETEVFSGRLGDSSTKARVEAVAIGGGTPRVVSERPYDASLRDEVAAVDDAFVFVNRSRWDSGRSLVGGDLVAIPKAGGPEKVLVKDAVVLGDLVLGPEWLYWIDYLHQDTIVRVRRDGGETERIVLGEPVVLDRIAVDRCNVYWAMVNSEHLIQGRRH